MTALAAPHGITFAVDDVEPETEPLAVKPLHEELRDAWGGIEACSDHFAPVLEDVRYQPLLAAVFTAFSQHRPLVLTPDAVWLTIVQGVAHHMALNGERLRSRFVAHSGRLELAFEGKDWVPGSPENPWPEAFEAWAEQIRAHVGAELHDALVCDFSTTGPVERAAGRVALMDVFERYFHYVAYCICGIPTVTLEGTPADWDRIERKLDALEPFEMDWWLCKLRPVCRQFARASRGDVDRAHWGDICKLRSAYGGSIINGWVAHLFPYVRSFIGGPCAQRNPALEGTGGMTTLNAPPGASTVPITWRDAKTGAERALEAIGGLVGVTQDPHTLALRPKVGWAIRARDGFDVCLDRVRREHAAAPPVPTGATPREEYFESRLPEDLAAFYFHTGGADLFGSGAAARVRLLSREALEPLAWGERTDDHALGSYGPGGRIWHKFAELADGTWLAINLDANVQNAPWFDAPGARDVRRDIGYYKFAPVCALSAVTVNVPGANPVVALSFGELLERLLASGGVPYWREAGFAPYADAEAFTRRK